MEKKLAELKQRLQEIADLGGAMSLLHWDQSTYMPPGGAPARGQQMATLSRIAQEKSTDPALGKLYEELTPYGESLPYDSDDAGLIRVGRREYERAIKVPTALVGELVAHMAGSYQAWAKARPANDFQTIAPYLEKTLDLSRRLADCFPGYDHIADPLIDNADFGMKAATIRTVFAELRAAQVPLLKAVMAQPLLDDAPLHQAFPEAQQKAFGEQLITAYGYDFNRGRQDKTHHPFMTKFSLGDVRITTRFKEDDLSEGLFSTLHEAGHALYEQGIDQALEATPLAGGTSAGVHESQSRLWENIVGRSHGFWSHYYPQLQSTFPEQLSSVPLEAFHQAVNRVQPSLIRTDADELTYNLHVMIRFDLELALLEGSLEIADLPEAWRARYESDLGIYAPTDVDGVLQDVHWYSGIIGGAFQGYTLGNIMSAIFYDAALQAHPLIPAEIARGEFATLRGWLTENVYQHGSKFTANELLERVTGGGLTIEPYMNYLRTKFGALYGVAV